MKVKGIALPIESNLKKTTAANGCEQEKKKKHFATR